MNVTEIPVAFEVEGDALIGIVHVPEQPTKRGVLAIVAGGPQYRGGCCRQLVIMARTLAAHGIPVMRFDYRGLGDGSGEYRGFESIGPDLAAAVATFRRHTPGLDQVVLWGGCDAASASMIFGADLPGVTGMILGNPFAHTEETAAKVVMKHYYLRRIRDKAFWRKVFRLRFNPVRALSGLVQAARRVTSGSGGAPGGQQRPTSFIERMRLGIDRFDGRILLCMSGLSLVSKEFDELVKSSPRWQASLARLDVTRVDFPDADQAFSTVEARQQQAEAALKWMRDWR